MPKFSEEKFDPQIWKKLLKVSDHKLNGRESQSLFEGKLVLFTSPG
jgi:hypothetical protein